MKCVLPSGDILPLDGSPGTLRGQEPPADGAVLTYHSANKRAEWSNPRLDSLPVYANNAAAAGAGLAMGTLYRTGADPDPVCVVH